MLWKSNIRGLSGKCSAIVNITRTVSAASGVTWQPRRVECICKNKDRLHCISHWGGQETPLSEHVYCVAAPFEMTEQVEHQICITFCIKLEHFSTETIWIIQKAAAMGNGWLAASSRGSAHLCITSHAVFLVKHQITQVTEPPYSPDLAPCDFWLFLKI